MASRNLKLGDVVALKCGGPPLVVADVSADGAVKVHWWLAGGQLGVAELHEAILELAEDLESRIHRPDAAPPGAVRALRAR